MSQASRIPIAVLGAGVFTLQATIPNLQKTGRFEVVAIYSRQEEKAKAAAAAASAIGLGSPHVYSGEDGARAAFTRPDVVAVVMTLPPDVMAALIPDVLAAGKHICSEKPVAHNYEAGCALVAHYYKTYPAGPIWSVAENYRFETCFHAAKRHIDEGAIGKVAMFELQAHTPMTTNNTFYHTEWRQSARHTGGYILDGGVHFIAALRLVLGEVKAVLGNTVDHHCDHLPYPDSAMALVEMQGGIKGTVALTNAAVHRVWCLRVVGLKGTVEVVRDSKPGYTVHLHVNGGAAQSEFHPFAGVEGEFVAFAQAVSEGKPDANTPAEALRDVRGIAMLLGGGDLPLV